MDRFKEISLVLTQLSPKSVWTGKECHTVWTKNNDDFLSVDAPTEIQRWKPMLTAFSNFFLLSANFHRQLVSRLRGKSDAFSQLTRWNLDIDLEWSGHSYIHTQCDSLFMAHLLYSIWSFASTKKIIQEHTCWCPSIHNFQVLTKWRFPK